MEELPAPYSTPVPEGLDLESWKKRMKIYGDRRAAFSMVKFGSVIAAEVRGRQLLEARLSPKQLADLRDHDRFEVTGSEGGKFVIDTDGMSGNVYLIKEAVLPDGGDLPLVRWCCHPYGVTDRSLLPLAMTLGDAFHNIIEGERYRDYRPYTLMDQGLVQCGVEYCQSDVMMMQMFMIETDEPRWFSIANPEVVGYGGWWGKYVDKMELILAQRQADQRQIMGPGRITVVIDDNPQIVDEAYVFQTQAYAAAAAPSWWY